MAKKRRALPPMNERETTEVKIGQRFSSLFVQVVVGATDRSVHLMSIEPHESESMARREYERRLKASHRRRRKRLDSAAEAG